MGGLDYITKPFQIREVLVRIKNQLNLQEAKLQIKKFNTELEQRVKERTEELELANLRLLYMASHDALTGLPNRVFFMEQLMTVLAYTHTCSSSQFAVLFLDCDDFKVVNDSASQYFNLTVPNRGIITKSIPNRVISVGSFFVYSIF